MTGGPANWFECYSPSYNNASRIPAAQPEGSPFVVFVLFVCVFVSLRKRTTKKKAALHRKGKMQKNSRYGLYSC